MSFLLDTDICSLHLRGDSRVFTRFIQHLGQLHVSTITAAELFVWAERSPAPAARRQKLFDFFQDVTIHAPDLVIAAKFGEIRAQQLAIGRTTPGLDLLIAATALVHGLSLVTHNVRDYAAVPALQIIDWLGP